MTLSTLFRAAAGTATGLLLASTSALAVVLPPPSFSSLVVFGDSLSDNGNLFALDSGAYPAAPYWNGRFSNGPVAVERLASGLGLSGAQFQNLAIGGARTGLTGSGDGLAGKATGMLSQLAQFGGAPANSGALYVVWGGANDMRDGLAAGTDAAVNASMTTAITNLTTIIGALHAAGARNFLLPNLPDLGLTPEARSHGAAAAGAASFVSGLFNQQLSAAYGAMAQAWTDEHFYYFNAMGAQQAITLGAPGNGFSNVESACLSTAGCNPATYLYWDSIHPTSATHAILGAQMLAAVPEPQAMLLMAAGLLVLLGVRQRQQR